MVLQLILYTSDNTNSNTNTSNQNTINNTYHNTTNNNNVCHLVGVLVHTPRDPVHQTEDRHFLASPWLG